MGSLLNGYIINSSSAVSGAFDLAVVGAGILGLSCARAAAIKGLRVVVIDRDAQSSGASVRNFGFITVTGQERGAAWARARRTCAIWEEVAQQAGIPILQRGLWMTARRPESVAVLEAFLDTEMGEGCKLLSRAAARASSPDLAHEQVQAVLASSVDLRVESREAIPKIAAWLAQRWGVEFLRQTAVLSIDPPRVETSRGVVHAGAVVVCPGDDTSSLYPERIARYAVTRCKLQMLRLEDPGFRLPGALMSDLGLVRYAGYSALPESAPLRARLEAEQGEHLRHGIHLIVVQSADGSLIVGDSHHYAATPDCFADERIDRLILEEFAAATGRPPPAVRERWIGTYAAAPDRTMFIDAPASGVRIVMITSGSGASTGFAIGEQVVAELCGSAG
ncbi:MAG TPA: TIGR03364 family FAD-dependent oxidoreductase [Steroidobacteraceae bacterium]|nr:TIGR03364 family FAD-dependent oxidoreductase [Steroidobacteraceae bacterium]